MGQKKNAFEAHFDELRDREQAAAAAAAADNATEEGYAPGVKFPEFLEALLRSAIGQPEETANEDKCDCAQQEALRRFTSAQMLDSMSTSATGMADTFELEQMEEVAAHLRDAAKLVRKAASAARDYARDMLDASEGF